MRTRISEVEELTFRPSTDVLRDHSQTSLFVSLATFLPIWRVYLPSEFRQKLFNINTFFVYAVNMCIVVALFLGLTGVVWVLSGSPAPAMPYGLPPLVVISAAALLLVTLAAVAGSSYCQRWDNIVLFVFDERGYDAAVAAVGTIRRGGEALTHLRDFVE